MRSAASFTPSSSDMSYTDRASPNVPHQHARFGFAQQQSQGHPNAQYILQHTPPQSGAHEGGFIVSASAASMGVPYGRDFPEDIGLDLAANLHIIPSMATDDYSDSNTVVPEAAFSFALPIPIDTGELPPAAIEHLFDVFIAHAQQVGATVIRPYLTEIALLRIPGDCMANCIFLWGAHFSKEKAFQRLKGRFLQRVLATLPQLVQNPLSIIHGV
ncbi:hypothetical protein EW145_g8603, partial [Phellinidium pouzarii]